MALVPCNKCGVLKRSGGRTKPAPYFRCRDCRRLDTDEAAKADATCTGCGVTYRRSRSARTMLCLPCSDRVHAEGKCTNRTCEWPRCDRPHQGHGSCKRHAKLSRPRPIWPRECSICGLLFIARRKMRVPCYAESCEREYWSRRTSQRICQRYHSEPEFRDKVLAAAHAHRADKLGLGDTKVTLAYLMERDGRRCGICRKPVTAKRGPMRPSIDHIVPLSRGGQHQLSNVQLAHYRCNLAKGNRGHSEQLLLIG